MRRVPVKSPTTKRVLNALSVLGGVQALHILCAAVRTKLAAIWIGPVGVGLITIYHSTTEFMSAATQLSLRQSAVRDLSIDSDNPEKIQKTTALVRRLALFLGLAGTLIFLVASPLLGWIQFGDFDHTVPFLILSVIMFMSAIAQGEQAIMQGCNRLHALARTTLYSSVTSSLLSLPLYYFFRLSGVVPSLLLFAVSGLVYSIIFSGRKAGIRWMAMRPLARQLHDDIRQGRGMLSLGFYMTVSMTVTLLASYIFVAYLNRSESTDTVGFYQSGYTVINSYIGLIFTSISMEFYPRLSATIAHSRRSEVIISHEIKIILSVLAPVIVLFICAKELIIDILYSSSFGSVIPYISIAILGTIFRAFSWPLAFVMPAKGDGRIYVVSETISSVLYLVFNIPLFDALGFIGLGIAYVLWYAVYCVIVYCICRFRYGYRLRPGVALLLVTVLAIGALTFIVDYFWGVWAAVMIIPSAILAAKLLK